MSEATFSNLKLLSLILHLNIPLQHPRLLNSFRESRLNQRLCHLVLIHPRYPRLNLVYERLLLLCTHFLCFFRLYKARIRLLHLYYFLFVIISLLLKPSILLQLFLFLRLGNTPLAQCSHLILESLNLKAHFAPLSFPNRLPLFHHFEYLQIVLTEQRQSSGQERDHLVEVSQVLAQPRLKSL